MTCDTSDHFITATVIGKRRLLFMVAFLALFIFIAMGMQGCVTQPIPKTALPAKKVPLIPGYPKPYKVLGKWYQPLPDAKNFRQRGLASWYGKKFHGRKTSNGERYNMYGISAAHKTLPLGTVVNVLNFKNNKEIKVRINDRGPFVRGRIIDLSYGAAKQLGVVGPGTTPVEIVTVGVATDTKRSIPKGGKPIDYYSGNFTFQVGAFKDPENARRLMKRLKTEYKNVHTTVFDNGVETFYRVRVGTCLNLEKAKEYEAILVKNGFPNVITVAE